MGTRQVTYASALVGSTLFFVLYSSWFSWYLLVLLVLLMPFDLALSLPGMLTKTLIISAPKMLEQGADGRLTITTVHKKPFPARYIKAWLRVCGEDYAVMRRVMCGTERGSRYEVKIDTTRSGITNFEIKRLWTVSLIGLFSIPSTVRCQTAVLIIPAPVKPENIVALSRGVILRPKPGGGFSEEHDLRQYRPGDPVRSIHWKVSAKHDSLIIREPLVPPPHSRLIHISKWNGADERDLILGRLRWVSDYLLKWELPYFVRLGDDAPIVEITGDDALADYLYRVLSGIAHTLPIPAYVPTRFTWVFRVNAKASSDQ
jgi:hypothetical protein